MIYICNIYNYNIYNNIYGIYTFVYIIIYCYVYYILVYYWVLPICPNSKSQKLVFNDVLKKADLKNVQNLQENTFARVTFSANGAISKHTISSENR